MVSSSSTYSAPARWSTTTFVLTSLLAASSTTTLVSAQSQSQSQSAYSSPSYNQASSTASASNSSTSTSSSSTNPLIPTSISTKCQSFLASLNGDSHLSSCTSPLLSALEAFQPSSSMNSYSPSTSSSVAETLATFCAAPSCDDTRIRGWLNQFNGNCSTELQAGNEVVLGSYDSLYILTPLKQSICEEDGVGGYCLIDIAKGDVPSTSPTSSSNSTSSPSASSAGSASSQAVAAPSPSALTVNSTTSDKFVMLAATSGDSSIEAPAPPSLYVQITSVAKRLLRRQQASAEVWGSSSASSSMQASPSAASTNMTTSTAGSSNSSTSSSGSTNSFDLPSLLPNSQTYRTLSLPFLFLTSSLPSSTLCTPCTKQILTNYISFESRQPYALGLANSPILGGQGDLWKGTGEKCGSGFLSNIMEMSGQQELTGSASTTNILTLSAGLTGLVGIAMMWF